MAISTDVVIIGAGPVGLFQVFELGLQNLECQVVDALPYAGGQCAELYPDKPIYDIPAIPMCTGLELTNSLLEQIKPFDPTLHFDQTVSVLEKRGEHEFFVATEKGLEFHCKAIVIAAGAGSFTPVKLRLDGIDQFEGSQMFYRIRDKTQHAGKDLIILGGGDSALDWAIDLADSAKSITVVNRTERFRAAEASVEKMFALEKAGKLKVLLGASSAYEVENGKLISLTIVLRDEDKTELTLPLDELLVFFGMSPKLGPIENWGLELERKLIAIDQTTFETSETGIYAVGDVSTYPGKKKLILSGFHEAAMCAFAIKQSLEPDKKINVQYTTTSSELQERLGVNDG
ncbi:MAG: NAD(P)/FAD-dependent oxidoreductase [Gammaproteobacteria bacterium]|nr:NAD(P)/FAD-dependent oxidoreductase [Gammaproteobacteria bacterium]